MKCYEIKEDQYINRWLLGIGAKENTKNGYIDSLRIYTEFLQKTPEQLIIESEGDIRAGKLMRERHIFYELTDFRKFLESKNIAPTSVKAKLTGVRSFFTFYGIYLPVIPKSAKSAVGLKENRAIPSKENIREVLAVADPLEKALILTGCSSGLAINEISNIKVQEFFDGYDKETEITTLHLIREKVGYEFYTFLSPEASKAIKDYLDFRERTSDSKDKERQRQLLKQKITYDKRGKAIGYLFINRYIEPEFLRNYDEEMRYLTPRNIQRIYRELNERARTSSPYGKRNLVRSHNLRKFFNSTLLANHAELYFTDFLMGHKIDGTRDAYFRADPKALREEYQKYIPFLTIQKELNVAESPEFIRIKGENEILARETAKHVIESSELQNLRNEMEELKKKKEEASQVTMDFVLEALKNPEVQEMLKKKQSE